MPSSKHGSLALPRGWRSAENLADLRQSASNLLLRVVDLCLAGVVFVAPFFMGGRHPLGRFALVALVWLMAAAWTARQCLAERPRLARCRAHWLLIAALVLVLAQLAPLPQSWQSVISPSIAETLPLWSGDNGGGAGLAQWPQLSLTPQQTLGGLVMLLTHMALLVVAVNRIGSLDDVERLLRWFALAIIMAAIVGLGQYFAGNGAFLWVYEHPYRDTFGAVKGPFSNENHYAHFLALGVGPLIWWTQRILSKRRQDGSFRTHRGAQSSRSRDSRELMAFGALVLVVLAGLLTYSRGGIVAMAIAAAIGVILFARAALLGKRSVYLLIGLAVLSAATLFIHGSQQLEQQLGSVVSARSMRDLSGGRVALWAALCRAIPEFPIVGTGVGSHAEVYPKYYEHYSPVEYTHAESGYFQVLLETGIVGVGLLLAAIGMCGFACVAAIRRAKSSRAAACAAAVSCGLAASVLHSVWDFVWYIPACMSLTVLLAACALRMSRMVSDSSSPQRADPVTRAGWALALAIVLAAGALAVNTTGRQALAAPHWEKYLVLSLASNKFDPPAHQRGKRAMLGEIDRASVEVMDDMAGSLQKALAWDPNNARARMRLASVSLRRFNFEQMRSENPMPLSQIRDAAVASRFSSREAQDRWLAAAVKDNRRYLDHAKQHTLQSLRLSPLQGEGYLFLAELAFLDSPNSQAKFDYVKQALAVRPYSGQVLLAAGQEAALAGDVEGALSFFQRSFSQGHEYQQRIVEILAPRAPAAWLLENFEFDLPALQQLFTEYVELQREDQAQALASRYAQVLEREAGVSSGDRAAELWRRAYQMHSFQGDDEQGLRCAAKAAQAAPNNFLARRTYAGCLTNAARYQEAVEQLRWCIARRPNDPALKAQWELAVKESIKSAGVRRSKLR